MKLSIIAPTYGRPENIPSILRKFLECSFDGIELILVDDNGINTQPQLETQAIIGNYLSKNIIYLPLKKNIGAGLARNQGVKVAKGTYISFIDDDDEIIYEELFNKLDFAIKNNSKILCSDMFYAKNGKLVDNRRSYFIGVSAKDFLLNGNCWTPMILINKNIFNMLGGFDDTPYFQDHTFILKAHIAKIDIEHYPVKTFIHNDHSGHRITGKRKNSRGIKLRAEYETVLRSTLNLNFYEQKKFKFGLYRSELVSKCIDKELRLTYIFEYFIKQRKNISSLLDILRLSKDIINVIRCYFLSLVERCKF